MSDSGRGKGVVMSCSRSPQGKPVAIAPHRSMANTDQLYGQAVRKYSDAQCVYPLGELQGVVRRR